MACMTMESIDEKIKKAEDRVAKTVFKDFAHTEKSSAFLRRLSFCNFSARWRNIIVIIAYVTEFNMLVKKSSSFVWIPV